MIPGIQFDSVLSKYHAISLDEREYVFIPGRFDGIEGKIHQ